MDNLNQKKQAEKHINLHRSFPDWNFHKNKNVFADISKAGRALLRAAVQRGDRRWKSLAWSRSRNGDQRVQSQEVHVVPLSG